MFSYLQIIAVVAVFLAVALMVYFIRSSRNTVAIVSPPILLFGLLFAFMSGCSPKVNTEPVVNIPESTISTKASVIPTSNEPTVTDDVTLDIAEYPTLLPQDKVESLTEPSAQTGLSLPQPTPTPQIIEVPVEVPVEVTRNVVVELPGKTVEIIKEVYVDAPLDGMDMRERQLSFIAELNVQYSDVFGMSIGGGEYCYSFTSHTEYLINYFFEIDNGEIIFSYDFPPLSLNADKVTLDTVINELALRTEE